MAEAERGVLATKDRNEPCQGYRHERTASKYRVFALLKRGLHGVYHHASPKHLHRYVGEFAFRLGDGDVRNHTLHRLDRMFAAAIGQRLTYKELIA